MYFEKDLPTSGVKKSRKGVWMVLAGAAAVAVGMIAYASVSETDSSAALNAYSSMLLDHHSFVKDQAATIDQLIQEGHSNRIDTMKAALNLAQKKQLVKETEGKLAAGIKSQDGNVKWGSKVAKKAADPKKLKKSFKDSKEFAAEIARKFKKSYGRITKLRQDLKIHMFDLGKLIHDVSLIAETTKSNARRTIRKLNLREKIKSQARLSPVKDSKVWKYAIKAQIRDLGVSLAKTDEILKKLDVLQKNCARTQDDLEKEIQFIKTSLIKNGKVNGQKLNDLEEQLKATGCINGTGDLFKAIFTLGISCAFDSDQATKIKELKRQLQGEASILKSLLGRMGYFDSLVTVAKKLTSEATGLMETTKRFRSKLANTKAELESDFTDEDIDDNLGDEDFANEMAETLEVSLLNLQKECDIVIKDTLARKHRLEKVLIWG